MPKNDTSNQSKFTPPLSKEDYEKLVDRVAERVYEMWREELKKEKERVGAQPGRRGRNN
jgi:dissimilatory sulfite reductase (desulfoviridin) alpha/beta subunit